MVITRRRRGNQTNFRSNSDQCEALCIVCGDVIVTRTQHEMQRIQTIRCGHVLRARATLK